MDETTKFKLQDTGDNYARDIIITVYTRREGAPNPIGISGQEMLLKSIDYCTAMVAFQKR